LFIKLFHPNFIINNQLIEIKGDHLRNSDMWKEKEKICKQYNIKILFHADIKKYLSYVNKKYGKLLKIF
jgi:hypothetical protein